MSYEAWGEPDGRPHGMLTRRVRLPACMGGSCGLRTSCARYHQADRNDPAERLCAAGRHDIFQPITVTDEQASEHHLLALIHGTAAELTPE